MTNGGRSALTSHAIPTSAPAVCSRLAQTQQHVSVLRLLPLPAARASRCDPARSRSHRRLASLRSRRHIVRWLLLLDERLYDSRGGVAAHPDRTSYNIIFNLFPPIAPSSPLTHSLLLTLLFLLPPNRRRSPRSTAAASSTLPVPSWSALPRGCRPVWVTWRMR